MAYWQDAIDFDEFNGKVPCSLGYHGSSKDSCVYCHDTSVDSDDCVVGKERMRADKHRYNQERQRLIAILASLSADDARFMYRNGRYFDQLLPEWKYRVHDLPKEKKT